MEKKFVEEYTSILSTTQAAIRAGYNEKTARFIGAENLTKPNIQQAIKEAAPLLEYILSHWCSSCFIQGVKVL